MGRHWILVLLVTIIGVGVAAFTVTRHGRNYEATASILVTPVAENDPNYIGIGAVTDTGDPVRTVQTAAALLDTPQAAAAAAQKMGRSWTRQRVEDSVTVTPRGQSNVLAVTATARTAAQATNLANTFATAAVANRTAIVLQNTAVQVNQLYSRLVGRARTPTQSAAQADYLATRLEHLRAVQSAGADPTLAVSQPASLPTGPSGASRGLVIGLAALGALVVGSIAALALEFFNRRVRDEHEISMLFPVPILAAIPKIARASRGRGLSPLALSPAAFEQVRMLRAQLPNRRKNTTVTMVTSADAGDGKTTTAAALAAAFAECGDDVVLFDLDVRQPGVASVFNLPPTPDHGAREINDEVPLSEMVVAVPGVPHLMAVPAPRGDALTLEQLIRRFPALIKDAEQLAKRVIVDTAPLGMTSDALRVAGLCDEIIFVARPRHTDRSLLVLARDLLTRAHATPLGIVIVGESHANVSGKYFPYGYAQGAGEPSRSWLDEPVTSDQR